MERETPHENYLYRSKNRPQLKPLRTQWTNQAFTEFPLPLREAVHWHDHETPPHHTSRTRQTPSVEPVCRIRTRIRGTPWHLTPPDHTHCSCQLNCMLTYTEFYRDPETPSHSNTRLPALNKETTAQMTI